MNHTAKKLLVGTVGAAGLFLATTATANADTTHKVAKNDTVWDLSQKYGVSIQAIEALNNIDQNSHLIVTGQTLKVPAKDAQVSENNNTAQAADKKANTENTSDVTVKAGDTLWTLAQRYNTSVDKLRELNGLAADAYLIHPGNVLKVNGTVQATQQPAQTEQPVVQQEATQEQAQESQLVVSANHTTHTVQAGESLYSIAQAYGVTVDSLRAANNLGATLLVGQTLTINDPAKDPAQEAAAQQAAQEQAAAQAQQEAAAQQAAQEQAAAAAQAQQQAAAQQQVQQPVQTQAPAQQTQQVQQQAQPAQVQQPQQQVVSTSADGGAIAAYAQSFIGTPYVWGGSTPSGFDCSGLTQYVYAHFGKQIGRNTIAQESAGTHIPVSQAQVGDLLFWGTPGSTYHVAIYLGGNSFVAAPEPGQSVKIGNMAYFMPSFAVHVN